MHTDEKMKEFKDMMQGQAKDQVKEQAETQEASNQDSNSEKPNKLEVKLEAKIAELEEQVKSEKDNYLRLYADLENFRRRSEREKTEMVEYGNEKLLKDLLPVLDTFAQTLDLDAEKASLSSFVEGIQLLQKQFSKTLADSGLTQIEAIGQKFDPNLHEAVGQEDSTDQESGTVLKEWRKGYLLNGRLLRPTMVVTAK